MTEEKAKSLIGRKVRGFKFKRGVDGLFYNHSMDKHIGEIGEIYDYFGDCFIVRFKDDSWYYPSSLIEAHLVEEEPTSEYHLVQIEGEDFSYKTVNITESELINQNEQLKAENAKLVDALKMLYEETEDYISETACGNAFLDLARNKSRELIEKHGK